MNIPAEQIEADQHYPPQQGDVWEDKDLLTGIVGPVENNRQSTKNRQITIIAISGHGHTKVAARNTHSGRVSWIKIEAFKPTRSTRRGFVLISRQSKDR